MANHFQGSQSARAKITIHLCGIILSVYIHAHIVPVGQFIVGPTQLFMDSPN